MIIGQLLCVSLLGVWYPGNDGIVVDNDYHAVYVRSGSHPSGQSLLMSTAHASLCSVVSVARLLHLSWLALMCSLCLASLYSLCAAIAMLRDVHGVL